MTPADFLLPLSGFYGILQSLDRIRKSFGRKTADAPVISVGNLTMGGTGKTPLTAFLCTILKKHKPVILTRGYGRKGPGRLLLPGKTRPAGIEAGDEPALLLTLTGRPVSVDANRYRGYLRAKSHGNLFILDDGFQHYRLNRNIDIVLLDASIPVWHYRLIPAGRLREPLSALRRAHIVILTRTAETDPATWRFIESTLRRYGIKEERIFRTRTILRGLYDWKGRAISSNSMKGKPVTAFAGIGNFASFSKTVRGCLPEGSRVEFLSFPDHHAYTKRDLALLTGHASRSRILITTEKDSVRLATTRLPFLTLRIALRLEKEKQFLRLIEGFLEKRP